jgi:hypothetical protein
MLFAVKPLTVKLPSELAQELVLLVVMLLAEGVVFTMILVAPPVGVAVQPAALVPVTL